MSIDMPYTVCYIIVTETKQTAQPGGKVGIEMKRYGEKATREALVKGATVRKIDDPMRGPVWRVLVDGEVVGYIVMDLFTKLIHDGTIEKSGYGHMYTDYSIRAELAEELAPFGVVACVKEIRSYNKEASEVMADLERAEEINGPAFNKTMWVAFDIVFPNFRKELAEMAEDDGEECARVEFSGTMYFPEYRKVREVYAVRTADDIRRINEEWKNVHISVRKNIDNGECYFTADEVRAMGHGASDGKEIYVYESDGILLNFTGRYFQEASQLSELNGHGITSDGELDYYGITEEPASAEDEEKKVFTVEIKQVLRGYVEVEAPDAETAFDVAVQRYQEDAEPLPDMDDVDALEFSVVGAGLGPVTVEWAKVQGLSLPKNPDSLTADTITREIDRLRREVEPMDEEMEADNVPLSDWQELRAESSAIWEKIGVLQYINAMPEKKAFPVHRKFQDTESGHILTLEDLLLCWSQHKSLRYGWPVFGWYVSACQTYQGGTLEEIK